jgi:hypothetical protein
MVARYAGIVIVVIFCSGQLCAQTDSNKTSATTGPPANPWEFNLSVSGYYVPNGQSYASPTFTADHDTLHLEARYNYEGLRTGSLWVGYNLTVGKKLGVAPGLEFTATYKKVQLFSCLLLFTSTVNFYQCVCFHCVYGDIVFPSTRGR